jgi:hypothetical protein
MQQIKNFFGGLVFVAGIVATVAAIEPLAEWILKIIGG